MATMPDKYKLSDEWISLGTEGPIVTNPSGLSGYTYQPYTPMRDPNLFTSTTSTLASNITTSFTEPNNTPKEKTVFKTKEARENSGLKTVKLTKDNLREVAAYILKNLGGDEAQVRVLDKPKPVGVIIIDSSTELHVGEWLVETYDYAEEKNVYRAASLDERKEYDLK